MGRRGGVHLGRSGSYLYSISFFLVSSLFDSLGGYDRVQCVCTFSFDLYPFFLSLLFFCCGSVSPSTDFGMLILDHASDLLFVIDPPVNLT